VFRPLLETFTASLRRPAFWAGVALVALCAWVYWPTFVDLFRSWATTAEYSHGFLVPVFAAYLLYRRRALLAPVSLRASAWGLPLLVFAGGLRLAGAGMGTDYLEAVALLPCLAGLALLAGAWPALRWSWPGVVFLLFMIPLPFRLAYAVSGPLRGVATLASGFTLQTLGLPVVIEGHTLLLDEHQIAIAEACNGLSMLFVFAGLATAVAIVSKRPALDRTVVLLSAVPIALVANVFRIALTALAYRAAGKEWGDFIYHDLAGWLMTPLALGLLWAELKLIDVVLVPAEVGEKGKGSAARGVGSLLFPQSAGPQKTTVTASSEKVS